MTTYGFKKNKGKHEVYTKDEADVRYVLRDNFAIINGRITISCTESTSISGNVDVNYPKGFTKNNCVVLNTMSREKTLNETIGYSDGIGVSSNAALRGAIPHFTTLKDNAITVRYEKEFMSNTTQTYTIEFKIILMKYEVLDSEYTLGDVNQDGQITQEDKDILDDHILNGTALTEQQFKAADINKDGYVDTGDAFKLQQYLANGTPLE